jgi:hypothetical protein
MASSNSRQASPFFSGFFKEQRPSLQFMQFFRSQKGKSIRRSLTILKLSYKFDFLLSVTPYHMKTLAMTGIIAPQAVRDSTVSKKPSMPVTTFAGES